jgi:hypothetical protein
MGISIVSTQPYLTALGAEIRVFCSRYTADMQAKWTLTYCYLCEKLMTNKLKIKSKFGYLYCPTGRL